jgi:hypothetical protein
MPEYLRQQYLTPDAYARTIYSREHRGGADGSFGYEYETDNAIKVKQESTGYGKDKVVRGFYSYIGADGKTYTVNYIADRFGYRAYGDHLPTQPSEQYDVVSLPRPAPQTVFDHNVQLHQQHHTQTAYYPVDTLQSQNIYVTETPPLNNYVTITPKPISSRVQLPVNILPPYNYIQSNEYNQPIAWTTSRPLVSY